LAFIKENPKELIVLAASLAGQADLLLVKHKLI